MQLADQDQKRLRSAIGYSELGMFEQADTELEEIDPFCRHLPEILFVRAVIYEGLRKWELMSVVAGKLVEAG